MSTPLYDALRRRAQADTARFHMPGHKGRAVTPGLRDAALLDFTELPGTGNLYAGGDVIEEAEALWAKAWGFPACQFLTCGATQGVYAALLLSERRGREVLVDRVCHRSVYHALGLWDLLPRYLPRSQDRPVDPQEVDRALAEHPEIKTVCITSPTYYGALSDTREISRVCQKYGASLVVDAAHGAHLPFLLSDPFGGASLVVTSPHKTLPVYGQGALLFAREAAPADLRWAAMLTGTSSPSYPIMASLDAARDWMEGPGREEYLRAVEFVAACRRDFPALTGDGLDPTRLTLKVPGRGFETLEALEAQGVSPEMADRDHVVFIVTGCDAPDDWAHLRRALEGMELREAPGEVPMPVPPQVPAALTPREALLAPRRRVALGDAAGLTAAETVAPYPPGAPVIAPGEVVTKKALAYLREIGYNVDVCLDVCDLLGRF